MERKVYSAKAVKNYFDKYGDAMTDPSNFNSTALKCIVKEITYGEDEKAYKSFFNLSFFYQCIFFMRYGKPSFISFKQPNGKVNK